MVWAITLWSFLFNIVAFDRAWAAGRSLEFSSGVSSKRTGSPGSSLAVDALCDEMKLKKMRDGSIGAEGEPSPQADRTPPPMQIVMSADEFEERLIDIFELDEHHTRRGTVHCGKHEYKYTMFETDLHRYTWHVGPVYFRAGDIFVLNATSWVSPKGGDDGDWRQHKEQKEHELQRLLKRYPDVIKLYESASDHHNGGWIPYTHSRHVSGRPYWLPHTIGILIAMQANREVIQGHTFIDAFSRNGLMANAAYILGASNTVVIENDPQEVNTSYLRNSIKDVELPETTDLVRTNLMINGNLDSSRIHYTTIRQVPEEEFEDAVLSFSEYNFGFDYMEASQTDMAKARKKAPLGTLKWGSWLHTTPEGKKIMATERKSLLRDIREKFRGVRWIIASGGTESDKLEDWGVTQKLIGEAKSLSLVLHSMLKIRQPDTVFDEFSMDSTKQTLIMPTLTFYINDMQVQAPSLTDANSVEEAFGTLNKDARKASPPPAVPMTRELIDVTKRAEETLSSI
jgi:hypothetical protein